MLMRTSAQLLATAATIALCAASPVALASQPEPSSPVVVQPAVDGIIEAFGRRPLVGLDHGHPRSEDIILALIHDPRFAREVGNIVLEGGPSLHQATVDRYVNGETVPYEEMRAIGGDGIGPAVIGVFGPGMLVLLHAVRDANRELPPTGRIKVWMGEPPLNWSQASRDDVMRAMFDRDGHAARVIAGILARSGKALVYYGGFHLIDEGDWLRARVEREYPGSFFVVLTYSFIHQPASCAPFIERAATVWPSPAIASPKPGEEPGSGFRDCTTLDGKDLIARGLLSLSGGDPPVIHADAIALFPSTEEDQSYGPPLPDTYLDTEYRRELNRRNKLGGPILLPFAADLLFRRSDYSFDFDAPGFAERLDRMFAEYDLDGDGTVTADEYADPVLERSPTPRTRPS